MTPLYSLRQVLTFSMISWIVLSFVLLLFCCCCCELVPVAPAAGSCELDGRLDAAVAIAEELLDVLIFCKAAADFWRVVADWATDDDCTCTLKFAAFRPC